MVIFLRFVNIMVCFVSITLRFAYIDRWQGGLLVCLRFVNINVRFVNIIYSFVYMHVRFVYGDMFTFCQYYGAFCKYYIAFCIH